MGEVAITTLAGGPDWIIAVSIYSTDPIDVEGPALRIAPKTFKLLRLPKLWANCVSRVYHSFPFSTV